FAEPALFDFNRNLLTRVLLQDSDGTASLRLPAVTAKDTFYVRVRGYWGDQFRYSEQEVAVQVYPRLQVPQPVLTGVSATVFAGSTVAYRMAVPNLEQYRSRIATRDQDCTPRASGTTQLDFLVPEDATRLQVTAIISDANGNSESRDY